MCQLMCVVYTEIYIAQQMKGKGKVQQTEVIIYIGNDPILMRMAPYYSVKKKRKKNIVIFVPYNFLIETMTLGWVEVLV